MFVEAVRKAKKAMFPIFRMEQISDNQFRVGVAGTGFFVAKNGYFISAAHVFDNTNENSKFRYLGLLPEGLVGNELEIEKVAVDDENDIFLGRVDVPNNDILVLSDLGPEIGKSICVGGYPLATIVPGPNKSIDVSGVRRYFQPSFILDLANCKIKNTAGKIRNHVGFTLRDIGLFGMSGGPVFDSEGNVFGIQGSVTDPRVSSSADKSITVINSVAIGSGVAKKLLDQCMLSLSRKNDSSITGEAKVELEPELNKARAS